MSIPGKQSGSIARLQGGGGKLGGSVWGGKNRGRGRIGSGWTVSRQLPSLGDQKQSKSHFIDIRKNIFITLSHLEIPREHHQLNEHEFEQTGR